MLQGSRRCVGEERLCFLFLFMQTSAPVYAVKLSVSKLWPIGVLVFKLLLSARVFFKSKASKFIDVFRKSFELDENFSFSKQSKKSNWL